MSDVGILDESILFMNLTNSNLLCGYTEEAGTGRFIFITLSSILALIGSGANVLLFYVFTFRTVPSTPPTLYPTFLSLLDTLICTFYVLFFGVDIFAIYLKIEVSSSQQLK